MIPRARLSRFGYRTIPEYFNLRAGSRMRIRVYRLDEEELE